MKLLAIVIPILLLVDVARADLTMADAKKVALGKIPGTIVHEKLEHKKSGHDIYSIKIRPRDHAKAGMVKKIEIDKTNGQVVKVKDVKDKTAQD